MTIGLLVSMLILSTGFQCVYAIKATRDWANPVVFFCGLHLVHNWITSLFYSIDDSYALGGVLIDITDEMIATNLTRNLIGLWTFFAVFLLCKKWWKEKATTPVSIWILPKHKSLILFWGLYIVFTALGVVAGSRGGDQALTAGEAFAGLFGILGLRSFFLMFALIQEGFRKKFLPLLIVFPVEFLLAGGARKLLLMTLLSWLFAYAYAQGKTISRAGLISFAKRASWMLIPAYLTLFLMNARRSYNGGLYASFGEAIEAQIGKICSYPLQVFSPLCSTDSESVQIWCSELVAQGALPLMYGKTYVQSVLNMIVLRPFQGEIANWQAAYAFKTVAYPTFTNHGWDFAFVAEAVLNWGNHFFFLSFAAFSLILSFMYKKRDASLFWQTLYFIFIAICFVSFRTDSTAMLRFLSFFIAVSLLAKGTGILRGSNIVFSSMRKP